MRGKLAIECTPEALRVLTLTPATVGVAPDPDPVIQGDLVKWHRSRHAVAVQYYDKQKLAWRLKTMKVPPGPDLQSRAEAMAAVLETFHAQHHTPPQLLQVVPRPSPTKL